MKSRTGRMFAVLRQKVLFAIGHVRCFFHFLWTGGKGVFPSENSNPDAVFLSMFFCSTVFAPIVLLACSFGISRNFLSQKKKASETVGWCLLLVLTVLGAILLLGFMFSKPREYFTVSWLAFCAGIMWWFGWVRKNDADYGKSKKSCSRCEAEYSERGKILRNKSRIQKRNIYPCRKEYHSKNNISNSLSR